MKKVLFMSFLACAFGVFTSCSSDDEPSNGTTTGEETTTATFGEVAIKVANANSASRAASSLLTGNDAVTNVTATSVAALDNGNFLVTYHGRNQEKEEKKVSSKGMVQIVNKDGNVLSELTTEKCRVNFAAANGKTVYIGLDKGAVDKEAKYHCAVATLTLTDEYLFNESQNKIPAEKVLDLEGVSVNCISISNGTVYLSTSTGDVNYEADGNTAAKTITYEGGYYTLNNGTLSAKGDGWSAYWYDENVKVRLDKAHSTTCFATVNTGTDKETQVEFICSDKSDKEYNYGRVSAAVLTVSGNDYLFTCGDQLIAWVYDSTEGKYVNMQDGTIKNDLKKQDKTSTDGVNCVSGSHTTAVATDGKYVYACTGSSVSKYYLREYTGSTNASYKGKKRFELKGKFEAPDSWEKTNSGTKASANHLYVKEGKVYVAFGYQGFVVLDSENDFTLKNSSSTKEE